MADDPNKSNKPINGKLPSYLESSFESRTHEIEHTLQRRDVSAKYDAYQAAIEAREAAYGSPNYQTMVERASYAQEAFMQMDAKAAEAINRHYAGMIATRTTPENIASRTTTMAGMHGYYRQARGSSQIYQATEILESDIGRLTEEVNQRGSTLAGRMMGLGHDYDIPKGMVEEGQTIYQMEQEIALKKRILKEQNRAGLSTEKLFRGAEDVMNRSESYFSGVALRDRVASGNVGTIGQEETSLAFRQAEVMQAQDTYNKKLESGTEDMSEFAKALKDATDALNEQQKVVDEMNRQGVSGGGMGWGDIGMIAALGGRAISTAARGQRMMWVDQQREEMANKAAYAARANRIYTQADAAIMGGDMDAMLELTTGALGFAGAESMFAKRFTNVAEGIAQIGDAAVGVGNTTQAAINGGKAGMGVGSAFTAKAAGVSQGVIEASNAAVRAGRLARGGFGAEQGIPTYDTALQLQAQMRAMNSRMFQTVYGQGMTTYNSVAGLGGAAGIQSELMNTGTLGLMAGVGLTPERAAQLTAGMRAAGSMSAMEAMAVVEGAGAAKQRGILSQGEYVGMASQLMGVGGAAGDLESIMAAAVASGMDNSKSISELVSGTLVLSNSLTSMGVSATGSTQSMLAAASQNLVAAGVDPNLAANTAAMSIGNFQAAQRDQGFTLGNIMERAGLRRMGSRFNQANTFQLNRLGEMTAADHKVLLDAASNPDNAEAQNRADQLLKAKGLTEVLNPEGKGIKVEDVREIQKLSFMATAVDKGALGIRGIDVGRIYDKALAGEKLTDKETALFQEFGGARAEAVMGAIRGDDPASQDPNSKKKLFGAGVEETQARFKLREMQDLEQKGPGNVTDIFKNIETTLSGIQENISPDKISEEVQKAAKEFEAPTLTFREGTKEFKKAVDVFVENQNKMMDMIGENKAKPSTDTLNKNKLGQENKRVHPKYGM